MCAASWRVSDEAGFAVSSSDVIRFLAIALLLAVSTAASAEAGLDLVVLLDCSKSMARHAGEEVPLLRLTADMLARNAASNRLDHRLAVIRFGSEATVDLPFTSAREVGRRIGVLGYEDRGETHVLGALVKAEQLFLTMPPKPERRRAIVMLTDGVPYVRGRDMGAYRASLSRFLARPGVSIDVLLTDAAAHAFWRDLARVELAGRTPDRMLAAAHGVIATLAGTQTAESAPAKTGQAVDTLFVPPYLDLVVFDIFRPSAAVAVEVFPPGSATPIRAGTGGIESVPLGDVLTTLAVPRPAAGEWTIRKSGGDARVRILSQQFFPRGTLLHPSPTRAPRQCDRVPLVYRVVDGSGRPFEELRNYTLALEVTLARPGATSMTVAMERDLAAGAGGFRSVADVACDLAGRYWTDVRITTLEPNGRRLDVFRDRWSGFSVMPAANDCNQRYTDARIVSAPMGEGGIALLLLAAVTAIAGLFSFRKTKS
jgi:von Willebrand factor type A domain